MPPATCTLPRIRGREMDGAAPEVDPGEEDRARLVLLGELQRVAGALDRNPAWHVPPAVRPRSTPGPRRPRARQSCPRAR